MTLWVSMILVVVVVVVVVVVAVPGLMWRRWEDCSFFVVTFHTLP